MDRAAVKILLFETPKDRDDDAAARNFSWIAVVDCRCNRHDADRRLRDRWPIDAGRHAAASAFGSASPAQCRAAAAEGQSVRLPAAVSPGLCGRLCQRRRDRAQRCDAFLFRHELPDRMD